MAQADLTGLGEITALLGRGTEFVGKLTFEGKVRIDGRFDGEIFADDVLIVGDGAEVSAEIDVGTVIINGGCVRGNIRAKHLVELHAPARVVGNIAAPALSIEKGVVFEGNCKMTDAEAVVEPPAKPVAVVSTIAIPLQPLQGLQARPRS